MLAYPADRLLAVRAPWNGGVSFLFCNMVGTEFVACAKPIIMEAFDKPKTCLALDNAATFSLTVERAQQLADELWNIGIRPSKFTDQDGEIKLITNHLEDMRRIVFYKLNMKEALSK